MFFRLFCNIAAVLHIIDWSYISFFQLASRHVLLTGTHTCMVSVRVTVELRPQFHAITHAIRALHIVTGAKGVTAPSKPQVLVTTLHLECVTLGQYSDIFAVAIVG